jgi:hypothetical protein
VQDADQHHEHHCCRRTGRHQKGHDDRGTACGAEWRHQAAACADGERHGGHHEKTAHPVLGGEDTAELPAARHEGKIRQCRRENETEQYERHGHEEELANDLLWLKGSDHEAGDQRVGGEGERSSCAQGRFDRPEDRQPDPNNKKDQSGVTAQQVQDLARSKQRQQGRRDQIGDQKPTQPRHALVGQRVPTTHFQQREHRTRADHEPGDQEQIRDPRGATGGAPLLPGHG